MVIIIRLVMLLSELYMLVCLVIWNEQAGCVGETLLCEVVSC